MKCLLYCLFQKPKSGTVIMPPSILTQSINIIEIEGLCAVFSEVSDIEAAYEMSEIVNYHKVIEWFFGQADVVPFRFGTVLEGLSDVERLLQKRAVHYKRMLEDLEDCCEVGIRAIIDEADLPAAGCCAPGFFSLEAPNPGKLYLTSRRFHYLSETLRKEACERAVEPYRTALDGLFKKYRSEVSETVDSKDGRRLLMISTYFLVPRKLLPAFRERFPAAARHGSLKALLSGPWPPYNFVLPDDSRAEPQI
ncbi:MAG: GvpL/GvpF family gas vesicle protein [Pseudomonadota bacterium]